MLRRKKSLAEICFEKKRRVETVHTSYPANAAIIKSNSKASSTINQNQKEIPS
jgi:hypothetical protein